jgi:putative ABC transport system permease protein
VQTLTHDLKYGLRVLGKSPGFTAVAVLTLALGIGANTAVFTIVNSVLLRPLPYPHSDRLVMVWKEAFGEKFHLGATPDDFLVWQKLNRVFEGMGAFTPGTLNFTGSGEPERLQAVRVTPGFFETLGIKPSMGREFLPQKADAGEQHVAILSYALWQRHFGSDSDVLGKTMSLDGEPYVILGVMPPDFNSPQFEADLWIPLLVRPDPTGTNPERLNLPVVARLKPGVTLAQAQANLNVLARQLHDYFRETGLVKNPSIAPLYTEVVGDSREVLLPLVGIVTLVLLIGCATVANLLLARASTRQREMALRTALGAGRWRLIGQLLTESVLLAIMGAVLGLVLAHWGLKLLVAANPHNIPRLGEISIDARVLCFTLALSVLTGILFGLAPALKSSKTDLNETLKEAGATGIGSFRHQYLRNVLVGSEAALALVLLIGAGLLINSLTRLLNVDPGFDTKNVLTMQVSLPQSRYPQGRQVAEFFSRLAEHNEMLPGVQGAGAIPLLPLGRGAFHQSFNLHGGAPWTPDHTEEWNTREFYPVTPGYCQAMGIRLVAGRYFTDQDNESAAPGVVLINKTLATDFFPKQNPTGKSIWFSFGEKVVEFTVVGVVNDTKRSGLGDNRLWLAQPPMGGIYIPINKAPEDYFAGWSTLNLVVRAKSDPLTVVSAVRAAVRDMDNTVPVSKIRTMQSVVWDSVSSRSVATLQLLILASVALILALGGIYGVVAYAASQRTHEVGVRMALGARRYDVLKLVMSQSMVAVLVGIAIGAGMALAFARVLSSQLYGISAKDPVTFVVGSSLFLLIAGVASYIPARRATRVDPIVALRYE